MPYVLRYSRGFMIMILNFPAIFRLHLSRLNLAADSAAQYIDRNEDTKDGKADQSAHTDQVK